MNREEMKVTAVPDMGFDVIGKVPIARTPDIVEEPIAKTPDIDQFIKNMKSQLEQDFVPLVAPHQHVYMFSLNANHTVVRGCIHCGETHASFVMGSPDDLIWHRIAEPE